jgi:hypothetical protein
LFFSQNVAGVFSLMANADSPSGAGRSTGPGSHLADLASVLILAPPLGALLALLAKWRVRVVTILVLMGLGYATAIALIGQAFQEIVHH